MIILSGGGAKFGLPELSPYVTKTEVQLRMAGLAYEKRQANPNACKDEQGRLRVAAASTVGDAGFERSQALIDAGVDALVIDTAHGHSKMVLMAVERVKKLSNRVQVIAGNVATADGCKALIDAGVDVNGAQGRGGRTALHSAAELGSVDVVKMLIGAGACVDARTALGETALYLGCQRGHGDVVRMLIDAGAHVNLIFDGVAPTYQMIHWARDRTRGEGLPLEFIIAKQTKRNADLYGMTDRGSLEVGKRADINVIDFERLSLGELEVRSDLPAGGTRILQPASGYLATFVNGVQTRKDDVDTGARPGRLVRS